MLSRTVTVAVPVAEFPLVSVTVRITKFSPTLLQSKVVMSVSKVNPPQESEEPLFTASSAMMAFPVASSSTEIFLVTTVGATLSCTVTTAGFEAAFPLLSVTVKVTVFSPTSEQVKLVTSMSKVNPPQESEDPLFTASSEMAAFPEASSCTVMFFVTTVGAILSCTVTIAVFEAAFPLLSVTVKVTVFSPTSEQVKLVTSVSKVSPPQESEDPLFTASSVMVAFPVASNCTLMFFVTTVGATLSCTVTIAVFEATFLLLSVTVKVTVFSPTSKQVKLVTSVSKVREPQMSEEPLFTASSAMVALPEASSSTLIFLVITVGAIFSRTVIVAVSEELFALLSVTVKVTVFSPTSAHVKFDLLRE